MTDLNNKLMNRLLSCAVLLLLAGCGGDNGAPKKPDTARVYQFPVAPAPVDTSAMVQPIKVDSEHLNMPVKPLPVTGEMPVEKPHAGVQPK